jgi:hypothetical protein
MAMIFDILDDERRRLLQLIKQYEREISELPKGSLSCKRRGNKEYYYLAYRDMEKVKFDYVGPSDSEDVEIVKQKIEERKALEKNLRRARENLKDVERSLRGQR